MLIAQPKQLTLNLKEVQLLFDLSSNILEKTEEFLEEYGGYKKEFLNGLDKSLDDARSGKIEKINSLRELIK